MKKSELKTYLETELKNYHNSIKNFEGDKNPQVVDLFNQHTGAYNALDEMYYKTFHSYYKVVE